MKKAIITGSTGFIGTHLTEFLQNNAVETTQYDPRTTPADTLPTADIFYHLAWEGATGELRQNPFTQTQNAAMTLQAVETAHKLGCKKFVGLGTIYEKLTPQIRESHEFRGADFYLLAKDSAHIMARKLAQKLGLDFTWCTICHPIGAGIKPEQLMSYAVTTLQAGKSPDFGPAEIMFDIVAVEDIALGLYLIGEHGKQQEYYIGSGAAKPLKDYLVQIPRILGVDIPVNTGARPDDGLRFSPDWFDITPLAEDTGYSPKIGFEQAVKNVANYTIADLFEKNRNN